jgi:hypothetical protein
VPLIFLVPWVAIGIAFVIAQFRFYHAHIERYGGPDRRERMRMFVTRPAEYVRLLRKPPFTLASMFRRVDDPVVERYRRQYLFAGIASVGYLVALFVGALVYRWISAEAAASLLA